MDIAAIRFPSPFHNMSLIYGSSEDFRPPVLIDDPRNQGQRPSIAKSMITTADIDGDQDLDIAVTYSGYRSKLDSIVMILYNDGNGNFTRTDTLIARKGPTGITMVDLDHDADVDIAVTNQGSNELSVFPNHRVTAVKQKQQAPIPVGFEVAIRPNPLRQRVQFHLSLPTSRDVNILIYNVLGQLVWRHDAGTLGPGQHEVVWDGVDSAGRHVQNGLYLYIVRMGNHIRKGKITVLR
jgi:hypothetical protein